MEIDPFRRQFFEQSQWISRIFITTVGPCLHSLLQGAYETLLILLRVTRKLVSRDVAKEAGESMGQGQYICKECGGRHGGSLSAKYCPDCYKKLFGK
jgi:hypothetical protein